MVLDEGGIIMYPRSAGQQMSLHCVSVGPPLSHRHIVVLFVRIYSVPFIDYRRCCSCLVYTVYPSSACM